MKIKKLLGALVLSSVAMLPMTSAVPASAAYYTADYWGAFSTCNVGAFCVNLLTVNSCTGTGNTCHHFDPLGTATDISGRHTLDWVPAVHNNAERGRNRDGSGRKACAYSAINGGGSKTTVPYSGATWVAFSFTGMKSYYSYPAGINC